MRDTGGASGKRKLAGTMVGKAKKKSVFIRTWGCTLNQSDSDIMEELIKRHEYTMAKSEKDADVVVLNTCTVKGSTENKILAHLKELVEKGRNVVVAGCLAASAKRVREIAPHAPIVGAGATRMIGDAIGMALARKPVLWNTFENKSGLPRAVGAPIARIPIEEGCTSRCAFCQTKLARPLLFSYPPKAVVRLVEQAVANGAKEIQLTGMDTGAYGLDCGTDLVFLLNELIGVKGDFCIRLGMINPQHVKRMEKGLAAVFRSRKMFRFLHVPVQTGSEKVCKEMNRQHTVADFERAAGALRKEIPGITIATDIIVAYPTESGEDYALTLRMLERVKPDVVNLSKFTPRDGTVAKNLPQLRTEIGKGRASKTNEVIKRIANENAQKFIGKIMDVFFLETGRRGQMKGRSLDYHQVVARGGTGLMGKKRRVRIYAASYNALLGEILEK